MRKPLLLFVFAFMLSGMSPALVSADIMIFNFDRCVGFCATATGGYYTFNGTAVDVSISGRAQQSRQTGQPGALTSQTETLQPEVLISTLPSAELTKQIAAATGTIEHKSEVARGGPLAAVVRTTGCMKDTAGACKINVDVVIYRPDGSVFQEAKSLDLPTGRGAVPLKIDANSVTGVYKVVVTVRDLSARRFATMERQFGVK